MKGKVQQNRSGEQAKVIREGRTRLEQGAVSLGLLVSLVGCSSPQSVPLPPGAAQTSGAAGQGGAGQAPAPSRSVPQEQLAKQADSLRVTGMVEVPSYEKGLLQVDVFPAGVEITERGPLTSVRVGKPGPFTLLLPAGTEKVDLYAVLDFEGNGPDVEDVIMPYPGNPVDVSETTTGVTFSVDKTLRRKAPPGMRGSQDLPPWEQSSGAGQAAPAATGANTAH